MLEERIANRAISAKQLELLHKVSAFFNLVSCMELRLISRVAASNAIELVDYGRESADANYANKIQLFHRFLIDHLITEGNIFPHNPLLVKNSSVYTANHRSLAASPVTQILGIDGKNVVTCSNCDAKREKENMTHVIDLVYPRKVSGNDFVYVLPDFMSL